MHTSPDVVPDGDASMAANAEAVAWSAFTDPTSSAEFRAAWLALQCGFVPGVRTGLLLVAQEGVFRPAAIWPNALTDVTHLGEIAERALRERRGAVHVAAPTPNDPTGRVMVAYPLQNDDVTHGVVVLDVANLPGSDIRDVSRALHWGASALNTSFRRDSAEDSEGRLGRAMAVLDLLAVAEDQPSLQGSSFALVNEVAKHLACRRVALGLRRGSRVRLRAVSHAAWFDRRSDLARALEAAMQEALDQNASVAWPPVGDAARRVAAAHRALIEASVAGAGASLSGASVILRHAGRAIGVLTMERDAPFAEAELALADLIGRTTGPLIALTARAERPLAGSMADATGRGLRAVFGPRQPALKLGLVMGAALVSTLLLVEGPFRISAKSVLEGAVQRAAVAPFQGYIAQAPVRAGDTVSAGQILALLDDADLRLERVKAESELAKLDQRRREAQAKHDRATLGIVAAQIAQAEAEHNLASEKLARTRILAPIDGLVVSGDLSQMLGSPIEQGKVLFEIAPLHNYRLVLQIDEGDIRYVELGQNGALTLTGNAETRIPFTIGKITAVSSPGEGRNTFRVEASLDETRLPLRPGMEGVAKVIIGERPLLWVWTRSLVARLRLFAWMWMP